VTRIAQVLFAVLVLATGAAFLLAQRIKQQPKAVDARTLTRVFSPNGDGTNDRARFSIRLKRGDDVDVTVLDRKTGREVRDLIVNRHVPANRRFFFAWDGRADAGTRAPDAYYKLLITLRGQGRSSIANKRFILDTTPPRPAVTAVGPGTGPFIVPARGPRPGVTLRVANPGTDPPQWTIWRTDVAKPVAVARIDAADGAREAYWDGRVDGRPAPAGTYLARVRTRDAAGNVGDSPAGLAPRIAAKAPGRPGITVRYLGAQVPAEPLRAGKVGEVFVDARGKHYRWRLRRIGGTRTVAAGESDSARLRLQGPGGAPGVYLLELIAAGRVYRTPLAVQPGKADRPILVVLPAISWQGRNPVDDTGQGVPDTLATTGIARLERPYAGDGLPVGFGAQEGALLSFLQRHGLSYDVTTDAALLAGRGPKLGRHRGVVLAGDAEWLPAGLGVSLRRYAQRGGNVLSLGTDALRRAVRVRDGTLDDPTPPQPADLFGSRVKALEHKPVELLTYLDRIGLFAPTAGSLSGYDAFEQTAGTGSGRVVAAAGEQAGQPVVVAYRFGKGLVIRTGLPQWTQRLGSDQETAAVTRRMWTLLSR
jgi:N,N-dimethylformamidase beta subunit-like, C-terminal